MRILLISDYGAPLGGAEIQMLRIRNGLRERGHDARLFASSAGGRGEADYTCYGTLGPHRVLVETTNPHAWWRLRSVVREFRPDVAHVRVFLTQLSPLILPVLSGTPSLYHASWYRPVCPTGTKLLPGGGDCVARAGRACRQEGCLPLRRWLPLMAQRKLLHGWIGAFDRMLAVSDLVAAELRADGIGRGPDGSGQLEVMPNCVAECPPRARLASPPLVVFAGRLTPEKGVDVLLAAFRDVLVRVPQAHLVIAGRGPDLPRLRRLATGSGAGDRIRFAGHLSRAALERELAGAWVQAVPSVWREPFGNVVGEAMMRGTAVIASAGGGAAQLIENGRTGFTTARADPTALRDALIRLLSDRELAEEIGARGRAFALAHLGETAYLERLLGVYSQLTSRAGLLAVRTH
jgi:glycosyltransferase involved in cell wall biosynthesis